MHRLVETSIEDDRLELEEASLVGLIHFLDTIDLPWKIPAGELSVAFVKEARCEELHAAFFDDDSLTDVMTFPGDPEDEHAGDLAICPAYAATHATEYGQTFAAELTLYLIHGWLHLAGLDDRTDAAREEMRRAESVLIQHLREGRHLLRCSWRGTSASV